MKKNFLIVTAMCALLVGVAPIASVSAAEVEQDVQEQTIQSDIDRFQTGLRLQKVYQVRCLRQHRLQEK